MMAIAKPPAVLTLVSSTSTRRPGISCSSFLSPGLHTSRSSSFSSDGFQSLVLQQRKSHKTHHKYFPVNVNALFGLGVPELVVIAGVAALIFGPKKLPEIGKSLGKTVKSFQQAAKEFESEIKEGSESSSVDKSSPESLSTSAVSEREKESTEA
ncbi:hypothetical protein KP509_14G028900 [Ceratopteris richardii]|uniref:Sec-independent protein translocase protein TATA, chloroplastic n=1 Tax=Ceratopteris richardii TaxID=49495 RepID=A0A8T2T6L9_CERRI|nr:hypothetical protein KP509_14G028900 [Ceratopteris richardii]